MSKFTEWLIRPEALVVVFFGTGFLAPLPLLYETTPKVAVICLFIGLVALVLNIVTMRCYVSFLAMRIQSPDLALVEFYRRTDTNRLVRTITAAETPEKAYDAAFALIQNAFYSGHYAGSVSISNMTINENPPTSHN